MTYFIIIRGPLGVGKSTIAKRLAEKLNGVHILIDKVLEENGLDQVDPDAPCVPAENFIKADEIVLPEVKKQLENSKVVVFDACFYHKEHLDHLIQNLAYPHYVFTLKAPLEACIERDSQREKTHGKDSVIAVHKLVSRFDAGIVIDTENKSVGEVVNEIKTYLS